MKVQADGFEFDCLSVKTAQSPKQLHEEKLCETRARMKRRKGEEKESSRR